MAGIDYYNIFTGTSATARGAQVICQTATTADSYFELDLREGKDAFGNILTNPDPGMGKPVFVNIVITSAPTGAGGSTTVKWDLQAAADAGGTGSSATGASTTYYTIASTGTIPYDKLVVGWKTSILIPPNMAREVTGSNARYLKILQTTGASTLTGGYYMAWLSGEPVSTV